MSRYRLLLLFLALFLAVGIGQGLFSVRALNLELVCQRIQFCTETLSSCATTLYEYHPEDTVKQHHDRHKPWDGIRHVFNCASARARRQGPTVLTTAEESANA